MALFNAKTKNNDLPEGEATPKTSKGAVQEAPVSVAPVSTHVLLSARVTEKATDLAAHGVYAFNVTLGANKRQVMEAVKALYKVQPVAVRMVKVARKSTSHPRMRKQGVSTLGKKAYVTLKKGDTISLA